MPLLKKLILRGMRISPPLMAHPSADHSLHTRWTDTEILYPLHEGPGPPSSLLYICI